MVSLQEHVLRAAQDKLLHVLPPLDVAIHELQVLTKSADPWLHTDMVKRAAQILSRAEEAARELAQCRRDLAAIPRQGPQ